MAQQANPASARLDHLDALRAVLMLYVVCVHALGYAGLDPGPARTIIEAIVVPVAVQGFYLVDGVLFARHLERARIAPAAYLRESARRLLWPWLFFGVIYLVARYVAERHGVLAPTALTQAPLTAGAIASMLWWSEIAPQLYFLPSLFLIRCVIVSGQGLLAMPAAGLVGAGIAILLLFRTAVEPAYAAFLPHDGLDPLLHALGGLGFFVLGAGLWRLRIEGAPLCLAAVALGLAILLAGLFLGGALGTVAFQTGYATALYFLFASRVVILPALAAIGRRTMGIYLLHMPVVMKISTLAADRLADPWSIMGFWIVVAITFAVAWALATGIAALGLSGAVFGERSATRRAAGVATAAESSSLTKL